MEVAAALFLPCLVIVILVLSPPANCQDIVATSPRPRHRKLCERRQDADSARSHVLLLVLMSAPQGGRGPPAVAEGRPQRPTGPSPEIAVATSPPSVTDAQDDNTSATPSSGAATTAAEGGQLVSATTAAEFKYPTGQLTINNLDSVVVEYDTIWTDVNLGVICSGAGVGGSKSYEVPLTSADGTYTLQPIDTEITVSEYPITCYLELRDTESESSFEIGPTLDITSTGGVASIYAMTATSAADPNKSASATDTKETNPSASPTSAGSTGTHAGEADSAATATDASGASTTSRPSSGTSAGAKAAIAFGVLLGIGLILLAVWFFYRRRRRVQALENELQETKQQHEKGSRHADGILKAAGNHDTRNGAHLRVVGTPHRGSGEWKKFFNARAASAAGGTAPPSRLGTATDRPKTAEALPAVPDSPKWAGSVSTHGDAASATDMVGRR